MTTPDTVVLQVYVKPYILAHISKHANLTKAIIVEVSSLFILANAAQ